MPNSAENTTCLTTSPKAISLFSGAGGMDVGFERAGFKIDLACEINRIAAETFKRNFDTPIHNGDVRELIPTLPTSGIDVIFGGPPCQGYSVAGKLNAEDPRSQLVFSFLEAVDRVKPKAFVMENVDALAKLAKWRGTLEDIITRAREIGYATHVEIVNAADYNVPQTRNRVMIWGSRILEEEALSETVTGLLADLKRPHIPVREVIERFGPAGTDKNPLTARAIITYTKNPVVRNSPYAGMLFNGRGRQLNPNKPSLTIAAAAGGNHTHIIDEEQVFCDQPSFVEEYLAELKTYSSARTGIAPNRLRRLTIKESMAIQTFPDDFEFSGKPTAIYRQIGNAVPCELAKVAAIIAMRITQ